MSKISRRRFVGNTGAGVIAAALSLAGHAAEQPPVQPFVEHDGLQCGFCTSVQFMSAKALLATNSPLAKNKYKIPLIKVVVIRTLLSLGAS